LQSGLGLRVGEVVKIKLDDIDFKRDTLKVQTEKANTLDILPLYPSIKIVLLEWFYKYEKEIKEHDGYIFFSDGDNGNRSKEKHVSPNWVRKYFRETCKLINLDEDYGKSDESLYADRVPRKLYRLTTHSFRHYFGTKLANQGVPIHVIKKLMRHGSLSSTEVYLNTTKEDMTKAVNKVFAFNYAIR
jgi:integrase